MKVDGPHIVMSELPGRLSMAYQVYGCDVHCPSCHSKYLWDENCNSSYELTIDQMIKDIARYHQVDCVLFLGGEWNKDLIKFLEAAKKEGKETALYTGRDISEIPDRIKTRVDFLKYGPYIDEFGGLNKKTTNQRMIDMKSGDDITSKFWRKTVS